MCLYNMVPVVLCQRHDFRAPPILDTHFSNTIQMVYSAVFLSTLIDHRCCKQNKDQHHLLENWVYYNKINDLLSKWNILSQRYRRIIILFVIIHPYFCRSPCIFRKYISTATGECIRMSLPKYMTNTTAWNYLQTTTTLPYSK